MFEGVKFNQTWMTRIKTEYWMYQWHSTREWKKIIIKFHLQIMILFNFCWTIDTKKKYYCSLLTKNWKLSMGGPDSYEIPFTKWKKTTQYSNQILSINDEMLLWMKMIFFFGVFNRHGKYEIRNCKFHWLKLMFFGDLQHQCTLRNCQSSFYRLKSTKLKNWI